MATTNLPQQPDGVMPDRERDLGFGTSLSNRKNFRLLNRDGSFNVRRHSPNWRQRSSAIPLLSP